MLDKVVLDSGIKEQEVNIEGEETFEEDLEEKEEVLEEKEEEETFEEDLEEKEKKFFLDLMNIER